MTDNDRCHCGEPIVYGYDGDPTHERGMCERCDLVRCDAYPGACDEKPMTDNDRAVVAARHAATAAAAKAMCQIFTIGPSGTSWRIDDVSVRAVQAAVPGLIAEVTALLDERDALREESDALRLGWNAEKYHHLKREAENAALRARLDAVLALHTYEGQDVCPVCVDDMLESLTQPCPTVLAATGEAS